MERCAASALANQSAPVDLSMRSVARALGISDRQLRRHLTMEGETYGELVEAAMFAIARRCLLRERRTIKETAAVLGFAEATSFHRAFKRWSGRTPRQFMADH
jgi:AraC-like DNA-binding protein